MDLKSKVHLANSCSDEIGFLMELLYQEFLRKAKNTLLRFPQPHQAPERYR